MWKDPKDLVYDLKGGKILGDVAGCQKHNMQNTKGLPCFPVNLEAKYPPRQSTPSLPCKKIDARRTAKQRNPGPRFPTPHAVPRPKEPPKCIVRLYVGHLQGELTA